MFHRTIRLALTLTIQTDERAAESAYIFFHALTDSIYSVFIIISCCLSICVHEKDKQILNWPPEIIIRSPIILRLLKIQHIQIASI